MLPQHKRKRVEALIEKEKLETFDECEDQDANEQKAIAFVRRLLLEFNSLEAAFYGVFHDDVDCAFSDLTLDDTRIDFLLTSLVSRDRKGRLELLHSFVTYAQEAHKGSDSDEDRILGFAITLVETYISYPENTDGFHLRKLLLDAMQNRLHGTGNYANSSEPFVRMTAVLLALPEPV